MLQDTQTRLVKRLLALAEAHTTDREERESRLHSANYVDETRYAREVTTLFLRLPVPVAHASTLA